MALNHVDRTGYPAAACNDLIKSATLGRSYALYAANVSPLESLGILVSFDSPGYTDILQSLGPVTSHQLVSTDVPCLLHTMTALCVRVTAQLVS